MLSDSNNTKSFEEEIQSSLNGILASDDSRRASFQLAHDEEQQIVAVSACFQLVYVSFDFFLVNLQNSRSQN